MVVGYPAPNTVPPEYKFPSESYVAVMPKLSANEPEEQANTKTGSIINSYPLLYP